MKLSRALGQRLGTFLDDTALEDPLVTRPDARAEGKSPHSGRAGGAYRYFSLGKGKADRHMEPLYVELPAGEKAVMSPRTTTRSYRIRSSPRAAGRPPSGP